MDGLKLADDLPGSGPFYWYVAFNDGGGVSWTRRICREGFRHVFAFGFDAESDHWVIYDPKRDSLSLRLCPPSDHFYAWIAEQTAAGPILQVKAGRAKSILSKVGFYCVPAVKHLIGADSCALRPYALYRHLLRNGAVPAFEEDDRGRRRTETA